MNKDQNVIAIIISIGCLTICCLFLFQLSNLTSTVNVLEKSSIQCDISSIKDLLDRNIEVFSIVITTFFTILAFMLGIIGYSWVKEQLSLHSGSTLLAISSYKDASDERINTNTHSLENLFNEKIKIINTNQKDFLQSIFTLYINQATLYSINEMEDLKMHSYILAADVMQRHPNNSKFNEYLKIIHKSLNKIIKENIQIYEINKEISVLIILKMIKRTNNKTEIESLSYILTNIKLLKEK